MATPRQVRRRGRFAVFAAVFVGALVAAAVAFGAVQTDQYYYSAGQTVQITGDGMNASENVTVDVLYPDASLAQEHVVQADANGNFADSYTLQATDPAGVYTVTATGQDSGASFTTTFDPTMTLTLVFDPVSPIVYGQSDTPKGALAPKGNGGDQTVTVQRYSDSGCTTTVGSAYTKTTAGPGPTQGDWTGNTYTPSAAGDNYWKASFAAETGPPALSAADSGCQDLHIHKADTSFSNVAASSSPISYGDSFSVAYELSSDYGISGNYTTGTVSVVKDTGPTGGSLTCSSADLSTLSGGGIAQSSDDGTTPGGGFDFTADGTDNSSYRVTCVPTQAGSYTFHVAYSGDGNYNGTSTTTGGLSMTVDKATTTTTHSAPATAGVGVAFDVAYSVSSSKGVKDNTTGGTVGANAAAGLGCGGSKTISATQTNSGFSYTADGTTNSSNQLSCTPTTPGTYSLYVSYSGDTNYNGSESTAADVNVPTVQVCAAAPSIAAAWLQAHGIKNNSPKYVNIVSLIAGEMASLTRAQFPTYSYSKPNLIGPGATLGPCDGGYRSSVEAKTAYWADNKVSK